MTSVLDDEEIGRPLLVLPLNDGIRRKTMKTAWVKLMDIAGDGSTFGRERNSSKVGSTFEREGRRSEEFFE